MNEPRIETLSTRLFVGRSIEMSVVDNKTTEVWRSFIPELHKVKSRVGAEFYALQTYDSLSYFDEFSPKEKFIQWAAVEVSCFDSQSATMQELKLLGGLYAVFKHKGLASEFGNTMMNILSVWLPQSDYKLDHRPHFQVMGEKYKNDDPNSEEEVWVPIGLQK